MKNYVDMDAVGEAYAAVVGSKAWKRAVKVFKGVERVLYIGHGGNLAIADHAAIDCTRITKGGKVGIAPGSAVVATSLINDAGWRSWLATWAEHQLALPAQTCAVVITTKGDGDDIICAIYLLLQHNVPVIVITARQMSLGDVPGLVELIIDVDTYHEAEISSLGLTYDLLTAAGYVCPRIK